MKDHSDENSSKPGGTKTKKPPNSDPISPLKTWLVIIPLIYSIWLVPRNKIIYPLIEKMLIEDSTRRL